MYATGNVESHTVGRIQLDHRGPAIAAVRNTLQPEPVGMRIMLGCDKLRNAGARVGKREARAKAQAKRMGIERHDAYCAALFLDEGNRRVSWLAAMRPVPAIGRKQGEP